MSALAGWGKLVWTHGRSHPKAAAILFFSLGSGALVFVKLYTDSPAEETTRQFLETLNGATWSSDWLSFQRDHRFWFAFLVATRTVLNLSVPLALAGATGWFLTVGWRKLVSMSILEKVRMHDARLLEAMVTEMNYLHPGVLSDEDIAALERKADRVFEELKPELDASHSR